MHTLFSKSLCLFAGALLAVFSFAGYAYAVPVEAGPICDISATVLDVEKTRTNINGLGDPPHKDFDYYAVIFAVHISTVYSEKGVGSCENLSHTKQNAIVLTNEYDKFPLAIGQYISGRVQFRGDEWFNGYFLSDMKSLGILRNMGVGSRGSDVTVLQVKLQELGYFPKTTKPTKYFGFITKRAVQLFQKANNIPTTGFVGPLTRAALLRQFTSSISQCLPAGTKINDVVDARDSGQLNAVTGYPLIIKVTVDQKLSQLGAYCSENNKLVDSGGREIIFYRLTGCWDINSRPYNYEEILKTQNDEINRLGEQHTVVTMTCNPTGLPLLP